jgi:hypothetical protein
MLRPFCPDRPFVRGINLPWLSYGHDFGRNAWQPEGGLALPDRRRRLDALFAWLARGDAHVVRWFVFCDGRAGLREDEAGRAEGLDDRALVDFAAAVDAAEQYGLRLLPVLLDFHWCLPRTLRDGVRCGGRTQSLSDSASRARLLEHALRPLLARFGGRHGVAAWDLINEPEWVTFSWRGWDPVHGVLPDALCAYIEEAAALVHEQTDHPATVGLASAASLPLVRGLGLDLYQTHWYDEHEKTAPLAVSPSTYVDDRPVILGEFPTRGSTRTPADIEAIARRGGYVGALAWSLCASDDASDPQAIGRWLGTPYTAG